MTETTEPVVPVRAWAEYSEWSVFIDKAADKGFDTWHIPKSGQARVVTGWALSIYHVFMATNPDENFGPLQSLRVLLSNGHELQLEWTPYEWRWYIHAFRDDPEIPYGLFRDDNDAEAVQRALTAAAAFFNPTRTPEEQVTA